ncbi:MAG: hypothetical protein ABID40_01160 [Candidatus Bipolaricaulota bacterium]
MLTLSELREAAGVWGDRADQFIHAVVWLRSARRHREDEACILRDLDVIAARPDAEAWGSVIGWLRNELRRHEGDEREAEVMARWYGPLFVSSALANKANRWLDEHPGWIDVGEEEKKG